MEEQHGAQINGAVKMPAPSTLQYVQPTDEQKEVMQKFRDQYEALLTAVRTLPMNRGLSIAITKLEESAMWINKSITKNC